MVMAWSQLKQKGKAEQEKEERRRDDDMISCQLGRVELEGSYMSINVSRSFQKIAATNTCAYTSKSKTARLQRRGRDAISSELLRSKN